MSDRTVACRCVQPVHKGGVDCLSFRPVVGLSASMSMNSIAQTIIALASLHGCLCVSVENVLKMNALSLADAHRSNTLRLSSRGLTEVPIAEILPVAATLSTLDLSKNAIAAPLTLPSPLPRLVNLSLADNALDAATVQRAAPLPPTLRVLDLGANRITVLPPAVLRLIGLQVLKIDRQQLRSLPVQLALMAELVELDAGFNELNAALALDLPGLPRLRRLVLRSNALARATLELDPEALPSLTELDLAGNGLSSWPVAVGALTSLRTLCLSNNRLTSLVSSQTVPHKRMWVPSAGVHTLEQLAELSVAQNALVELPASLVQLRTLTRLDVRCNPLSPPAVQLAKEHCEACRARLDCTSLRRAASGLLIGDESSAWHWPTIMRAHVSHVLSVGAVPADGVPEARLLAKLPRECALLGIGVGSSGTDGSTGTDGGGGLSTVVTVEGLRRAFRACALRDHPDKQQQRGVEPDAAASSFAQLQEAYRTLGKAVATERRRLPEFEELVYAFIDLPANAHGSAGTNGSAGTSGPIDAADAAGRAAADAALGAAFRDQLPIALAFAAEACRAADGELLVHAAGRSPGGALAVVLAILIDKGEATLEGAASALWGSGRGDKSTQQRLAELPPVLRHELEMWAAERRTRELQISHEEGSHVPTEAASRAPARPELPTDLIGTTLTMCDPFAQAERVEMAPHAIYLDDEEVLISAPTVYAARSARPLAPISEVDERASATTGDRRYNPSLSVVDPFAGADGMNMDPFANLESSIGGERYQTLSPVQDEIATGGMPALPPPEASETSTLDFSTDLIGPSHSEASTSSIGLSQTSETGWHVDAHGRNVLVLPERPAGNLGGRFHFTTVVVEHEPGARVGSRPMDEAVGVEAAATHSSAG